jgi:hypothetical protein
MLQAQHMFTSLVSFAELFVLPLLAALGAGLLLAPPAGSSTSKWRRPLQIGAVVLVAYSTAYLSQFFRTRSATPAMVESGQNLSLQYQAGSGLLNFQLVSLISADSSRSTSITDLTGELKNPNNYQPLSIPLSQNNFKCSEAGGPTELPFDIPQGTSRRLACTVTVHLTPFQQSAFFQNGDRALSIVLTSSPPTKLEQHFCFVFTDDFLQDISRSKTVKRRFVDATC